MNSENLPKLNFAKNKKTTSQTVSLLLLFSKKHLLTKRTTLISINLSIKIKGLLKYFYILQILQIL